MLSDFSVAYLFVGGTAAGLLLAASVVGLACDARCDTAEKRQGRLALGSVGRVVSLSFIVGFFLLVFGEVCLVFDLGRVDRVIALIFSPSTSYLSIGSLVLVLITPFSALLAMDSLFTLPSVTYRMVRVAEMAVVPLSVAMAVYTGLLLKDMVGVAFWSTTYIPILFALSAFSCGLAVMAVCCALQTHDCETYRLLMIMCRVDAVLIVSEIIAVFFFVTTSLSSEMPGALQSARILFFGEYAPLWWVGFFLCGLILPLVVEVGLFFFRQPSTSVILVLAAFVLIGGFSLRFGVSEAGVHQDYSLMHQDESCKMEEAPSAVSSFSI